jgi:hypothetical protein
MLKSATVLLLLVACTAVLAACGDSSSSDGTTAPATATVPSGELGIAQVRTALVLDIENATPWDALLSDPAAKTGMWTPPLSRLAAHGRRASVKYAGEGTMSVTLKMTVLRDDQDIDATVTVSMTCGETSCTVSGRQSTSPDGAVKVTVQPAVASSYRLPYPARASGGVHIRVSP